MSIEVCVGNAGYYAESELRDCWIKLPVDPVTIHPWLVEHGLYDSRHEETYISDYELPILGLDYGTILNEHTPLEHLNLLAALMDMLPLECETLTAFIETSGEEPDGILGLANWLIQADDLPYYSYDVPDYCRDDSPEEKYGYQVARYTGWYEELEKNGVSDYFSLEDYGRAWSANVSLGDDGYVDLCADFPYQDRYSWAEIEAMMPWHNDSE